MKKFLKCSITVIIALSFGVNAFAATDLDGHWAKNTIDDLVNSGYISGYSDGSIKPDNLITRAEFMSAVNSIFGFSEKADINFSDIKKIDWYYDTIGIAVKAGYVNGYEDNTIKAENYITKQEAVFIVNKIMGYTDDSDYADKFTDGGLIDGWVKGAIGALAKNGIINGYSDGSFKAKNNVTRAEAFTILNNANKLKGNSANKSEMKQEPVSQPISENKPAVNNKFDGYSMPSEVSNFEDWKKAILYSVDMLQDTVEIKIVGFNNETYDLEKLGLSAVSIKAEGSIKNGTATIKYSFNYKQNFKLLRAVQDGSLSSKLSSTESSTIKYFTDVKNEIIKENMTDYEKELAIHDYIVSNFEYVSGDEKESYYNVVDFVNTKIGYCEAYAYSFAILATLAGLENQMVFGTGNGINHAWNAVKLDGEYYYVDTTYDDGSETSDIIIYNYFNLNDDTLSQTHKWSKEANENITANGTKYNYFNYNNLVFNNLAGIEKHITDSIANNSVKIYIYADNFKVSESDITAIIAKSSDKVSGYGIIGDLKNGGGFTVLINYRN